MNEDVLTEMMHGRNPEFDPEAPLVQSMEYLWLQAERAKTDEEWTLYRANITALGALVKVGGDIVPSKYVEYFNEAARELAVGEIPHERR